MVVLHADEGIVQAQDVWPMVHRGDLGETVSAFVADHYEARRPRLLLTPVPLLDGVEAWLEERRGAKMDCRVPMRGDLATLRRLADQNAEVQVARLARRGSGSLEQRAADEGAVLLGLDRLDHVVCFDMAQLQGEQRVGASVVLRNGRPAKKEYRTYTVKGEAMDDLRMMQEVVQRWLKRQDEWPDLLLLDGGQTHLDAIKRTLEEAKVWGRFEVAALAKREETVFREGTTPSSSTVTDACWCMRGTKRTASSTASIASVVDEARWRTRWNPLRASVQRKCRPSSAILAVGKASSTPALPICKRSPASEKRWQSACMSAFTEARRDQVKRPSSSR